MRYKHLKRYVRAVNIILASSLLFMNCHSKDIDPNGNLVFLIDKDHTISFSSFKNTEEQPVFSKTNILQRLPVQAELEVLDIAALDKDVLLIITRKHGIYKVVNLTKKNEYIIRIDSGLPPEAIYPFEEQGLIKPVVSHSLSADKKRIALLFSTGLFLSYNGGYTFKKAPLTGMKSVDEPLAAAWHPQNHKLILIGTSFNGIYYSINGGQTVNKIEHGIPGEPIRNPFLLEEVRSLCFGSSENTFFAGFGNGGGVWQGNIEQERLVKLSDSSLYTYPNGDFYMVENLNYLAGNLILTTNRNIRKIITFKASQYPQNLHSLINNFILYSDRLVSLCSNGDHISLSGYYRPRRTFHPHKKALNKHGLYISYTFTQRENYEKLINLLSLLNLNAVVINLKDDYGSIRVPTDDPVLNQVPEAVDPYLDVKTTIKKLKQDGIYVIGRMVIFKDEHLYKYKNHKYAVKDTAGHVFLKGPEMWVDAYSEFVWDYNIRAAKAIVEAGVDEIQFDYIRFPDIRNRKDTRKYDFQKKDQIMREAIISFLKKAREELNVPLSIDLFGYNAISKMGNWIGQDIAELARYVDVVSPMFYPSHYGGSYAADYGDKRIYYIIYLSCKRTKELIGDAHLRPYIQAFYYKENTDNYCVDYIGWELEGLKNCGHTDFIFWNNLQEYTILIRGLRKYRGFDHGPLSAQFLASIPRKLPFSSVLEKEVKGAHNN
jgi:hypothetical protein